MLVNDDTLTLEESTMNLNDDWTSIFYESSSIYLIVLWFQIISLLEFRELKVFPTCNGKKVYYITLQAV